MCLKRIFRRGPLLFSDFSLITVLFLLSLLFLSTLFLFLSTLFFFDTHRSFSIHTVLFRFSPFFSVVQTRLRAEAQKALAQAQPMAHMQIEIEKMSRKKSPLEEIMSFHGINLADPGRKLTKTVMERDMNLAQLQVTIFTSHN